MLALTMSEDVPMLLERATHYRGLARTVSHDAVKQVLLMLAADYVALVHLLVEKPSGLDGVLLPDFTLSS